MIKKFLILFFILLIGRSVFSQEVFNKLYDYNNENEWGMAVKPTLDGGYLVVSSANYDAVMSSLFVVKTNFLGNSEWKKGYFLSTPKGGVFAGSVIQLFDSSYIICGDAYDSLEKARDSYLIKVKPNGDSIWFKSIEGGFNDWGVKLMQVQEGYIMLGWNYDSTFSTSKISLIKTDSNGNKLWQKLYGADSVYNFANSVFITDDGGFMIGGETEDPSCNWCYKIYLIKTDSAGNLQWEKQYGHPLGQRWGYAVPTQDGGYIISGRKKYLDTLYYGYVIKTDDTGKVIWEKEYGENDYFKGFKRILQLADGSYLAAGDNQHHADTLINDAAWLVKIDSVGNMIWDKTYAATKSANQNYLEDIVVAKDGGFVFTGWVFSDYDTTLRYNNVWLVKTDCEGNEVKWDSVNCKLNVGIEEPPISERPRVKVYPNPFTNTVSFEIPISNTELKIYNLLGELIFQKTRNTKYETITLNFPSGIYIYKITLNAQVIAIGKLAVQ